MADYLIGGVILLSIVTALYFLIFTPKKKIAVNYFGAYCITVAVFELIAYFTSLSGNNNLYLLPIYTIIEYILLVKFFLHILRMSAWWNIIVILGVAFIIVNSVMFQDLTVYNSYAKAGVYFVILALGIYSLFDMITTEHPQKMESVTKLFVFGVLIKIAGSFALYLFSNLISQLEPSAQISLWTVNIFLNFIGMLLFLIGFVIYKRIPASELELQ